MRGYILISLLMVASVSADSAPYEYEQSYNTAWHPPASPKTSFVERQFGAFPIGLLAAIFGVSAARAAGEHQSNKTC